MLGDKYNVRLSFLLLVVLNFVDDMAFVVYWEYCFCILTESVFF